MKYSVVLRNLVANRNNCFDAQISQMDKVLFCLCACLSAENGERASLRSVTKIQDQIILNRKKRSIKKTAKEKQKKNKKKKNASPEDKRHDTRACISMNQSVGRGNTQ